jgi:hypothetical protein
MLPAMVAAMLLRRDEYTDQRGFCATSPY